MRWTVGLAVFFSAVLAANAIVAWFAFTGLEPVDPTYESEAR